MRVRKPVEATCRRCGFVRTLKRPYGRHNLCRSCSHASNTTRDHTEERCAHCRQGRVCRPRGLCWKCFYTDDVRERYPMMPFVSPPGYGFGVTAIREPQPTAALPGTPEKIEVMRRRAMNGERIFHPRDAKR